MVIRHPEKVLSVGDAELQPGDAYSMVTVSYMSAGKIAKQLVLRESDAALLAAVLQEALDERPTEDRAKRFQESRRAW